ncbi:hypothetical protein VULLAG_LOCUS19538 [Vulpes lagopus]
MRRGAPPPGRLRAAFLAAYRIRARRERQRDGREVGCFSDALIIFLKREGWGPKFKTRQQTQVRCGGRWSGAAVPGFADTRRAPHLAAHLSGPRGSAASRLPGVGPPPSRLWNLLELGPSQDASGPENS